MYYWRALRLPCCNLSYIWVNLCVLSHYCWAIRLVGIVIGSCGDTVLGRCIGMMLKNIVDVCWWLLSDYYRVVWATMPYSHCGVDWWPILRRWVYLDLQRIVFAQHHQVLGQESTSPLIVLVQDVLSHSSQLPIVYLPNDFRLLRGQLPLELLSWRILYFAIVVKEVPFALCRYLKLIPVVLEILLSLLVSPL